MFCHANESLVFSNVILILFVSNVESLIIRGKNPCDIFLEKISILKLSIMNLYAVKFLFSCAEFTSKKTMTSVNLKFFLKNFFHFSSKKIS